MGFDHGAMLCEALGLFWKSFHPELDLPELPSRFADPGYENPTYYGGSFNPWHDGHSECVKQYPGNDLIVLPDSNPLKESKSTSCYFKRFNDVREKAGVICYPGFYGLEQGNPTITWLEKRRAKTCSLLIGFDNVVIIEKWREWERVLSLLNKIYLVPRQVDQQVFDQCLVKVKKSTQVEILESHPHERVSSTDLRRLSDRE
jgi:nicotinate-nucleotide adenylyltransferase